MWLINTTTLELRNVVNPESESYAILSHTWGDEEVSFQDFHNREKAASMKGFLKIRKTCELALGLGLSYAWVDTCCIDKTSSAELSEAINSMFQWYRLSKVCFAYLSDLAARGIPDDDTLGACKWFQRGWTLQELIAPTIVQFYNQRWEYFSSKKDLAVTLRRLTGIRALPLFDSTKDIQVVLDRCPVATKMSWAANRETQRPEDMAYCLLGLFGISMPMLYGEGDRAFVRLQEEICRQSNDMSLFAWVATPIVETITYRGVFAEHPREFRAISMERDSKSFDLSVWGFDFSRCEYDVTNRGLRMDNARLTDAPGRRIFLDLGFHDTSHAGSRRVGISLEFTLDGYVRSRPHEIIKMPRGDLGRRIRSQRIYLQTQSKGDIELLRRSFLDNYQFWNLRVARGFGVIVLDAVPSSAWSYNKWAFLYPVDGEFVGFVHLSLYRLGPSSLPEQLILVIHHRMQKFAHLIITEGSPEWRNWERAEYGLEGLFSSRNFRDYVESLRSSLREAAGNLDAIARYPSGNGQYATLTAPTLTFDRVDGNYTMESVLAYSSEKGKDTGIRHVQH